MDELDRIRKRIAQKEDKKERKFHKLYYSMIVFMIGLSIMMGGLIVTNTSIPELKNLLEPYLKNILVFEKWILPPNRAVNSTLQYQLVDNNYYINDTNTVYAIADGIVIYKNDDQVIVKNDNGLLITYGNLSDLQVEVDDRILKNSILGIYQDKVYLDFYYDEQFITYEEALHKD